MPHWWYWGWLFLAGGIGTVGRYLLGGLVHRVAGFGFPWGTLCVNVTGCFLFALVWSLAEDRLLISGQTRFLVLTGFMGAFTTFSAFAFETGELLRDAQWLAAFGNLAGQNLFGLAAIFLGYVAGRAF